MKVILLIGLSAVTAAGQEAVAVSDVTEWATYRNAEYGYSVRYPNGFELWATGPVGQRDGRAIRIARSEYAAPVPVMDIFMQSGARCAESVVDGEPADLQVVTEDVDLGGQRAREVTYRWNDTGEIAFVDLCVGDAMVQFHAAPGLGDFRETTWWTIISTLDLQN